MKLSPQKFAVTFPGQGSQYPGMSKELVESFPYTKLIFEEASDAIRENLLKLCNEGSADALQLTRNAQPSILVTSYAWYRVLSRELGFIPESGAGHSLGEYSALLASGAVGLVEAAKLVQIRGELMQTAVPVGKGKMAAVLGLDDTKVERLCELATESEESVVVPANFNSPGQVVIAGHNLAVDRAKVLAHTHKELKARKFIDLNVSAPFHSPLMKEVAESFSIYLSQTHWGSLTFPLAFNVDGEVRKEGDLIGLLRRQIDSPVRWTACVRSIALRAISRFVEPGPARVLTSLGKRIVEGGQFFSIDSLADFRNFEKQWEGGK